MRHLVHEYATFRAPFLRETTLHETLRVLHSLRIDHRPPGTLTRRDVAALIEPLPPSAGRHALSALSAVFKWGLATGRLENDPTAGLRRNRAPSRDRVLTVPELRVIWSACGQDHFGRIVRALILTGCRRAEIGGLRWAEVRPDRIALPAARVKNHRPHDVPMTDALRLVIPERPKVARDFCFGRRRSAGFSGWSRCKARLDSGLTAAWTLHDLRRSFVTNSCELGLARIEVIEAFVNHQSGVRRGVAGVYNRAELWPERVRLAGDWEKVVSIR